MSAVLSVAALVMKLPFTCSAFRHEQSADSKEARENARKALRCQAVSHIFSLGRISCHEALSKSAARNQHVSSPRRG